MADKPIEPTPGNWRPGKRALPDMPPTEVVSDCECDHLFPCCRKTHGGHLVAQRLDPADVPLIAAAKKTAEEVGRLRKVLRAICDSLYGQGFQVAGWHMNGALEPLDTWFDDNEWCEDVAKTEDQS